MRSSTDFLDDFSFSFKLQALQAFQGPHPPLAPRLFSYMQAYNFSSLVFALFRYVLVPNNYPQILAKVLTRNYDNKVGLGVTRFYFYEKYSSRLTGIQCDPVVSSEWIRYFGMLVSLLPEFFLCFLCLLLPFPFQHGMHSCNSFNLVLVEQKLLQRKHIPAHKIFQQIYRNPSFIVGECYTELILGV